MSRMQTLRQTGLLMAGLLAGLSAGISFAKTPPVPGVVAEISGTFGARYPGVNSGMDDSMVPSG